MRILPVSIDILEEIYRLLEVAEFSSTKDQLSASEILDKIEKAIDPERIIDKCP